MRLWQCSRSESSLAWLAAATSARRSAWQEARALWTARARSTRRAAPLALIAKFVFCVRKTSSKRSFWVVAMFFACAAWLAAADTVACKRVCTALSASMALVTKVAAALVVTCWSMPIECWDTAPACSFLCFSARSLASAIAERRRCALQILRSCIKRCFQAGSCRAGRPSSNLRSTAGFLEVR